MKNEDLILQTLRVASFAEELREWEILELAKAITVHEYKAGTYLIRPGESIEKDALIILASGEAEVTAAVGDEPITMKLLKPGDLAGVITFVGGNLAQISATVLVKADSTVLRLDRSRFETLLADHPAIVYYVMRGIVRQLHGLVRNMNAQSVEMTKYIHRTQARY